jgi:predicted GNAT superfamily acetyltransferase
VTDPYDIRELRSAQEFQACYDLQRATWGEGFAELVPVTVLRIAQRLGGVVAGAFDGEDTLLGFVFGITGVEDRTPAHWSDMLAVRPELRNRGVGEALKRYQRTVLLERGVQRAYWTFDPLESKNAYINFVHLGIVAREYCRDLYGDSVSPLHQGIGTDRLIAIWELNSPRVQAALAGERAAEQHDDAPWVIPLIESNGLPIANPPQLELETALVRIPIPADIQLLKETRLDLALTWRAHTRAAFEHYLGRGYTVTGFRRNGPVGAYTLLRDALLS